MLRIKNINNVSRNLNSRKYTYRKPKTDVLQLAKLDATYGVIRHDTLHKLNTEELQEFSNFCFGDEKISGHISHTIHRELTNRSSQKKNIYS